MIKYTNYKPRIFPISGSAVPAEIDRVQSIDPTASLNSEKQKEVGSTQEEYVADTPEVSYAFEQNECANIEIFQKLVGSDTSGNDSQTAIDVSDFNTAYFDMCAYLTDDAGTFTGTLHYPALRVNGFSYSASGPKDIITRNFDLVGEKYNIWQGDNKYFIYHEHTASGIADTTIDLSSKVPAVDPDVAGTYLLKVYRVRSGVATELVSGTDYTYTSGTTTLEISSIAASDIIKTFYTSATAPTTQFTANTTDPMGLRGDSVSIYLYIPGSGKPAAVDYMYKLQSVSVDVSFDRADYFALGNTEVVQRGINDTTVSVDIGRFVDAFTLEEVLRGATAGYGKIDITKFSNEIALIVKQYTSSAKTSFAWGFKCTGLSPMDLGHPISIDDYTNGSVTLEGSAMTITKDLTELGI